MIAKFALNPLYVTRQIVTSTLVLRFRGFLFYFFSQIVKKVNRSYVAMGLKTLHSVNCTCKCSKFSDLAICLCYLMVTRRNIFSLRKFFDPMCVTSISLNLGRFFSYYTFEQRGIPKARVVSENTLLEYFQVFSLFERA